MIGAPADALKPGVDYLAQWNAFNFVGLNSSYRSAREEPGALINRWSGHETGGKYGCES